MVANTRPSRWQNNLLLVRQESASLTFAQAPRKRQCCDGRLTTDDQPALTHTVDWSSERTTYGEASVVQNHIEERLMNPDATVVFNKAEIAKTIHEEANAGPGGADHFGQSFLRDLRN
jgi:hypothetical protein